MRKEGIRRYEKMGAGNEDADSPAGKIGKKVAQLRQFLGGQDRESWQRASNATVKCGRNSPYAALAAAQFLFFLGVVFLETVRGVRDDGMD